MSAADARRSTLLRAAAAALAVAAALGPRGGPAPRTRVLLVDVSASVGQRAASDEELIALREGLARGERSAVLVFAENAGSAGDSTPSRWASSLASALRAAERERRRGGALEILVATDARITDDGESLDAAVRELRAGGGATLRILPRASVAPPASLAALSGPGRALAGETVTLEAAGIAGESGAVVDLLSEGEVLDTRRVDRPGPFRVAFRRVVESPGVATFEARTRESPDAPQPAARVVVAEPGAVAVLHEGPLRPALAQALAGVRVGSVVDIARSGAADLRRVLEGHDAVVVDDLGGEAGQRTAAVRPFVAGGGGALFLGGAARGAFARGAAESFLPLRTSPPEENGPAIYLAIDGSSSMEERPAPGVAAGATLDEVARAAADALFRNVPLSSRVFLRRFRERLPEDPPAELTFDDAAARAAAADAVRRLPAPGGSTAFLPVLAEALEVLGARAEPTRIALLLTDGRSREPPEELRAAADRLFAAGVRVAVVRPGPVVPDASLTVALDGKAAIVRGTEDLRRLPELLVEVERASRVGEPFVSDRALETTDAAAPAILPAQVPGRAARLLRTWPAPDATLLARTPDGVPAVALRREGAGLVAAIAAPAPDGAWLDGDHGVALVGAMTRAVRRRGAASVRVEVVGRTLRARVEGSPGAPTPTRAAFGPGGAAGTAPLRRVGRTLFEAELPPSPDPARVAFLADDGTEIASAGLDRRGAPEATDPPELDMASLARRLRPDASAAGTPLRPYLAALALALLVAGSVKSPLRRAR